MPAPRGHSPHFWLLQDPNDPLEPVHGHALLEAAQPWGAPKLGEFSIGGKRCLEGGGEEGARGTHLCRSGPAAAPPAAPPVAG